MRRDPLLEFTDGNFDAEVLASDIPVLVDIGAAWCSPCNAIEPTITELAFEYVGRAKVGKFDFDSSPARVSGLGVGTLPTFLVFKDGQVVKKLVGGQTAKKDLAAAIDSVIP